MVGSSVSGSLSASIRSVCVLTIVLALSAVRPAPAEEQVEGLNTYEYMLIDLSRALGALHHLRSMCYPEEHVLWRERMKELIRLEQPSRRQMSDMTRNFNDYYHSAQRRFPDCTRAALSEARLHADQAVRIADRLLARLSP
ncbi:MAG: TIGR02301 family protein [Alphaproteobacteria bacterium]